MKWIGLSECSVNTLKRAKAVPGLGEKIIAAQMEFSPYSLDIEKDGFVKAAKELGVSVVAYSPLGRGFLTGRYRSRDDFEPGDFRLYAPRYSEENFPKNLELVHHIDRLAKKKGVTNAQLTLAWVLSRGEDIVPIPGTTRIEGLKENFGALNVTLTEEEKKEVEDAARECVMVGDRYPESMMDVLFADTVPLEGYKA